MRQTVQLNYDWKFIPEFNESFINNQNIQGMSEIMIPHAIKELPYNYFDENDYQLIGTYQRTINVTEDMIGHTLLLDFQAVMTVAKIYLDGKLLLIHEGGYTPFQVDITEQATVGEHLLQVIVDSSEVSDVPPFGHLMDYLAYGGIYREVSLHVLPKIHIKKLYVTTDEAAMMKHDEMLLSIYISLAQADEQEYKIQAELFKDSELKYASIFEQTINKEQEYHTTLQKIERWTLENPALYVLKVSLLQGEVVIDSKSARFGFRTVQFSPEGFFLNNKHIKLIGLNRHQSYPYVGYAMPQRMQELDADILKEHGCNIVRTSHYMQSEHFINRCDEIGLLVLEEIPGWQHIGGDKFKELTYQNLKDMINAHFNHPSIITWGVRVNESPDDHDFYLKTNELAHLIDPGRPTCGIRNIKKSEFFEDVYTYNDFSHVGNNPGLENPRKVTVGPVPYMVTEHNGHVFPTKKFDTETKRVEQALRHTSVIDSAFEYKRISGAIGWCMADYNTHIQFGSNDRICYHGVMDMFRIPKYAAYAYQCLREDQPILEVASAMIPGDQSESKIQEAVIFTNCDYVRVYKNDKLIADYYPDYDQYPYLPHPPIFIDDFIGDLLINSEEYPPKIAKKLTRLLVNFNLNGWKLSLRDKLTAGMLFMRKKIKYNDLLNLFEKYLAHQADSPVAFRFEGYKDDNLVITKTKGQSKETHIEVVSNTEELIHGDTYDVARVIVSLKDQHGNILDYASETFSIDTSKHLSIIGPATISLIGGSIGFYVKTTGIAGKSTIKIKPNNYPEQTLQIKVEKKNID